LFNGVDWENLEQSKKALSKVIAEMENNLSIPKVDYSDIHDELSGYYNIAIQDDISTQEINDLLTKLQNTRSRVAYITKQSLRIYKSKKSILDILTPILSKDADPQIYKNKESREGFAMERLADLVLDVQVAEFLKEDAEMCLENLNDLYSTVSRQISVLQMEMELGQISRPGYSDNEDFQITHFSSSNIKDATWESDDSLDQELEELNNENEEKKEDSEDEDEFDLGF
jgi:hypothetical protein